MEIRTKLAYIYAENIEVLYTLYKTTTKINNQTLKRPTVTRRLISSETIPFHQHVK